MWTKSRIDLRLVFALLYLVAFIAYIIYGLQPARASSAMSIDGVLKIPDIDLSTDVVALNLKQATLNTPTNIVGSFSKNKNKTLLIGHSSGVFSDLEKVKLNSYIHYDGNQYSVTRIDLLEKSIVDMSAILSPSTKNTVVLMTCAGANFVNNDSSHRLIIYAEAL